MPYSCLVAACARSCRHLAVATVQLPALLCCEAMVWTVAFLTFPVRLLAAFDRERKLDRLLGEMQGQMERVVWENRELEERLRAALKEHAAMEEILDEMEEEHEEAFARIDLLKTQLKALKKENTRLNEHKGKSMWDKAATAAAAAAAAHSSGGGGKKTDESRAWEAAGEDQEEEEAGGEDEEEGTVFGSGDPYRASSPSSLAAAEARLMRVTARRQSLFSLGMSLAVGGIAWSADAPCLPLLAGLLTVVGMSMRSVAGLFRPTRPRRMDERRRGTGVRRHGRRRGAAEPQLVPPGRAHVPHAPGRGAGRPPARREPRRPRHRVARRRRARVKSCTAERHPRVLILSLWMIQSPLRF